MKGRGGGKRRGREEKENEEKVELKVKLVKEAEEDEIGEEEDEEGFVGISSLKISGQLWMLLKILNEQPVDNSHHLK